MQHYKGGVRVTMLCGLRALADYGPKYPQAREISALLCAKVNEMEAVRQLKDENDALKHAAAGMEKKLVRCHGEMIPENEEPVCIFTDDLEGESMRTYEPCPEGDIFCAPCPCGNEADGYRYVMGSRQIDMRAFCKKSLTPSLQAGAAAGPRYPGYGKRRSGEDELDPAESR